jgi:hypothetical protein
MWFAMEVVVLVNLTAKFTVFTTKQGPFANKTRRFFLIKNKMYVGTNKVFQSLTLNQ